MQINQTGQRPELAPYRYPLTIHPLEKLPQQQGTAVFSHRLLREEFHPERGHNLGLGKFFQDDAFLRKIYNFKQNLIVRQEHLFPVCTPCSRFVFDRVPGLFSVTVQHRDHNLNPFVIVDTNTALLVEREDEGCQSATFLEHWSHAFFFFPFLKDNFFVAMVSLMQYFETGKEDNCAASQWHIYQLPSSQKG